MSSPSQLGFFDVDEPEQPEPPKASEPSPGIHVGSHVDGQGRYWLATVTIQVDPGTMLLSAIGSSEQEAVDRLNKQIEAKQQTQGEKQ